MSAAQAVQQDEPNSWWTTLRHQGVLLSPIVLEEVFPDGPPEISELKFETLRRSYRQFRNDPDKLYDWLDTVLEDLLGHSKSQWVKETNVPPEFRRGDLRPNRVLLNRADEPRAMVWIDTDRVTTDEGEPGRIGIYSGKRTYAQLVRLLRETGTELGILTNGHQFRVVHATLDSDSWTEWNAEAWFEGGEGRRSLRGFYGLLSDAVLPPPTTDDEESLIGRIEASRDRQADLSDVMGTQVREAVELLLRELDGLLMEMSEEERETVLEPLTERDLGRRDELRARYQAAIRIVMRLVVALYAESRELFPKDNPVYYNSYSVEGLFRDLREARIEEGEDALEKQYTAWPRLQALSRLIYHGSPHKDIPLRAYGGRLFRPPREDGDDDVLAGLEVFEDDEIRLSDATILEALENLKIAEFRSGGQSRTGPVDFSDLRTEYIGMMYEGLLDYELREALEDDGAILFLNIGDQPALPFSVLENLDDDGLDKLVDNLKDNASDSFLAGKEVSDDDFEQDEQGEDDVDATDEAKEEDELHEFTDELDARVHQWAKRVVEETGVYMPHFNTVRAMDPTTREKYENKAASRVVDRVIRPGGTYLVSHSGTRKSTGTFYTPPGLAVPTVHRTLEPLAYEERTSSKVPKKPAEILDLQVCDPAMGSGTFPVAALRYLTDALKESFEEHVFPEVDVGDPIAAPLGETAKGYLNERLLEIRKGEEEDWQDQLEIQLKRAVVERCIYGVDINPLAVELGKLSLWIETLDPNLSFTFLDHKLRVGNSLIGAWLDEFEHYPVAAWNREGGGGKQGERTKRIKEFRNGELKDQMQTYIHENLNETHWFEPDSGEDTRDLLKQARKTFEELHDSVDEVERERLFHEEFQENEDIEILRHLMDRWCAVWFWPMDSDDTPVLDPSTFYNTITESETEPIVRELANRDKLQFFHWELEFPDVFGDVQDGFDAIIGNPPWDKAKPNPIEFFTRYRPEFRTYGKRESKKVQKALFKEQPHIEKEWLDNVGFYRGFSNYVSYSNDPWDVPLARGKKSTELENSWRNIRNRRRDSGKLVAPYRSQGSADLNTYKMFLEKSMFLTSGDGRLGLLLPSGIYSDFGTQDLRMRLRQEWDWEWVYGFENNEGIFPIHRQFRFCVIMASAEGDTTEIKTNFLVTELAKWRSPHPPHISMTAEQVTKFSPWSNSFLEVTNKRDLEIITDIYSNARLIGSSEQTPYINYTREFDLSNDSNLFDRRENFEKDGFSRRGAYWFNEDGDMLLPLYSGTMIDQFDFADKIHVGGNSWESIPPSAKEFQPKYLMSEDNYHEHGDKTEYPKLVFRDISNATNKRTMISAMVPNFPLGNKTPRLDIGDSWIYKLCILGVLNSYVVDFVSRRRLKSGGSLNWYIVKEFPIPQDIKEENAVRLARLTAKLNWHSEYFPPLEEITDGKLIDVSYQTDPERRANIREEIDEIVMESFGLSDEDMNWILRENNDDSRNLWRDYKERLTNLGGEGFWGSLDEEEHEEITSGVE